MKNLIYNVFILALLHLLALLTQVMWQHSVLYVPPLVLIGIGILEMYKENGKAAWTYCVTGILLLMVVIIGLQTNLFQPFVDYLWPILYPYIQIFF